MGAIFGAKSRDGGSETGAGNTRLQRRRAHPPVPATTRGPVASPDWGGMIGRDIIYACACAWAYGVLTANVLMSTHTTHRNTTHSTPAPAMARGMWCAHAPASTLVRTRRGRAGDFQQLLCPLPRSRGLLDATEAEKAAHNGSDAGKLAHRFKSNELDRTQRTDSASVSSPPTCTCGHPVIPPLQTPHQRSCRASAPPAPPRLPAQPAPPPPPPLLAHLPLQARKTQVGCAGASCSGD